jgi:hypothetical protein
VGCGLNIGKRIRLLVILLCPGEICWERDVSLRPIANTTSPNNAISHGSLTFSGHIEAFAAYSREPASSKVSLR